MAHFSRLEAVDRGINLRLSAHHEGPVHDQWLADQGSRQNEKVSWVKTRKRYGSASTAESDGVAARKRLSAAIRQNSHAPVNHVNDGIIGILEIERDLTPQLNIEQMEGLERNERRRHALERADENPNAVAILTPPLRNLMGFEAKHLRRSQPIL